MKYPTITEDLSANAQHFGEKYSNDPDFIQRYDVWTNLIDRYSENAVNAYDMGCGTGIFSFYLAASGIHTVGYDGAEGMIEICNRAKKDIGISNIEFKLAMLPLHNYTAIPKVDLIISSSVIEYIDDVDATIRMFNQLLKTHGKLIVSFPNRTSVYRKIEMLAYKTFRKPNYFQFVKNIWTKTEATDLFEKFGFNLLEYEYYGNRSIFSKAVKFILGNKFASNLTIMVFEKKEIS